MLLQTRVTSKKGGSVKVNGNVYEVDEELCIDVTDEDAKKLLQGSWTTDIISSKDRREKLAQKKALRPKRRASTADAREFVEYVAHHPDIRKKCDDLGSFSAILEQVVQPLGYNFTRLQLEKATAEFMKKHPGKKAAKTEEAPEPEVPSPEPVASEDTGEGDGEEVVAEGEWPAPTEDMDLDYLKEIADAYEVTYAPNIGKKTLVDRINEAMFDEE